MAQAQLMTSGALPPHANGLPFLGNALQMRVDPLGYFVRLYHQHGSVFRITLLGQTYTVMAGIEANRFLAREGDTYFSSENLFGGLAGELGSSKIMVAMDGPTHRYHRKLQQRGFSRGAFMARIPDVIRMTADAARAWKPGELVPLFPTFQRMITDQLGAVMLNFPIGERFDDLYTMTLTAMRVHVLKSHPGFLLRRSKYVQARERMLSYSRDILKWHRENPPVNRAPDLIDDMLNSVDENGDPIPEDMLIGSITGGYFAGMDTVSSTASYFLYAILKHPGLLARVLDEVDALFEGDSFGADAFRKMTVLHNTAVETLRYYPIAPFTPRTVVQPFDFGGYHFAVGTEVYVAQTITHFLPEYYPNPNTFDPDRYERPDQPKAAQVYAPFTLGAHTCLGAGWAEAHLMIVIAALLRTTVFRLNPRDPDAQIYGAPLPNPGRKFGVEVLGPRKGIPVKLLMSAQA